MSKVATGTEMPGLEAAAYQVTDVWTGEDLGCVPSSYSADALSHDTAAILVENEC